MNDTKCKNPDCDAYPYYGVAPHVHKVHVDIQEALNIIGTALEVKNMWPKNFHEDPDAPGCGAYSCPECGATE